jgi:hypothetical protein
MSELPNVAGQEARMFGGGVDPPLSTEARKARMAGQTPALLASFQTAVP